MDAIGDALAAFEEALQAAESAYELVPGGGGSWVCWDICGGGWVCWDICGGGWVCWDICGGG